MSRKVYFWIIGIILGTCIIGFFVLRIFTSKAPLVITQIQCRFNNEDCLPEQWDATQPYRNQFLYTPIENSLLGFVVTVKRQPPNTVEFVFEYPSVLLTVYPADAGNPLSVGVTGLLFPAVGDRPILPIIDYRLQKRKLFDILSINQLDFYTTVNTALTQDYTKGLIGVKLIDESTVSWQFEGPFIALTTVKDASTQLNSLQQVLQTPTIDVKSKSIDLRFRNPVIKPL